MMVHCDFAGALLFDAFATRGLLSFFEGARTTAFEPLTTAERDSNRQAVVLLPLVVTTRSQLMKPLRNSETKKNGNETTRAQRQPIELRERRIVQQESRGESTTAIRRSDLFLRRFGV